MIGRANPIAARIGAGVLAVVGVLVFAALSSASTQPLGERSVLLLYAESRQTPGIVALDQEIRAVLQSSSTPIRFYTEHLDASWFPESRSQRAVLELLRQKYRGRKFDLVIPAAPAALQFALAHRATLFRGAPIVFVASLHSMIDARRLPPDVIGTWLDPEWETNLDLVSGSIPTPARLQPCTVRPRSTAV